MPNIASLTPYVRLPVRYAKVQVPGPGRCCGVSTRNPFCGSCGKPVSPQKVEREVCSVDDPAQVMTDIACALSFCSEMERDGYHYWQPNASRGLAEQPNTDLPSGTMVPVTPEGITSTLALFKEKYRDEIEALARAYGSEPEVGFGFLVEYE